MMTTMTKKALLAALKERLAQDDRWARRAEQTIEHNGIGFSGPDAEILSSFARQYQQRGSLSPRQMTVLRRKIPSYAGQVARVADTSRLTAVLSCHQSPQFADSR